MPNTPGSHQPTADLPGCAGQQHPARGPIPWNAHSLDQAARLFKALADGPRLHILASLAEGPACVSELATAGGESLSTMSQRLKILHNERLVSRSRQGKHIQYALADQHVLALVRNALEHASETKGGEAEALLTDTGDQQ